MPANDTIDTIETVVLDPEEFEAEFNKAPPAQAPPALRLAQAIGNALDSNPKKTAATIALGALAGLAIGKVISGLLTTPLHDYLDDEVLADDYD